MTEVYNCRSDFYPDYRERTAGKIAEINTAQTSENASLSANSADGTEEDSGFMGVLKSAIDIANPLQHIPIVGSIYRQVTGDEISTPAKIAGDTLYGGALGGAISIATSAIEYAMNTNESSTTETAFTASETKHALNSYSMAATSSQQSVRAQPLVEQYN